MVVFVLLLKNIPLTAMDRDMCRSSEFFAARELSALIFFEPQIRYASTDLDYSELTRFDSTLCRGYLFPPL